MKYFLMACLSLAMTACNTTYKVPEEPAPALWQGQSGIKIAGQNYKTMPGVHEEWGVFAEIDADHVRKGRLSSEAIYETTVLSGSDTVTLPVGTPLYAMQYTQSVTTSGTYVKTSTATQARNRNPIEWCAERPDNKGAVCIFWENPKEAFYLEMRGSPVGPQVGTIAGKRGLLPSVVEDSSVKFRHDLKVALQIGRISKKHVYVLQTAGSTLDGKFTGSTITYQKKKWDDDGSVAVNIAGGEFLLTAVKEDGKSKPKAVKVSVINSPKITRIGTLTDAERAQLMELLAKAIKKEN